MNGIPAFAGKLERFLANLVDSLATMLLPAAVLAVLHLGMNSPLGLIITFAANAVYFTAFTAGPWQATPGQRLFGMVVARLDGRLLGRREALERFLAYYIPSLPMYLSDMDQNLLAKIALWLVIVWFSPILWRADRRGVHDLLCGTIVVTGKR
jgi:uncharacterized RDD family membrane protein YckC